MPINDSNDLQTLVQALNYFYDKTKGRITFEYILFDGINETEQDAKNLTRLCRQVPVPGSTSLSTIPSGRPITPVPGRSRGAVHPVPGSTEGGGQGAQKSGKDIDAACGQLANK